MRDKLNKILRTLGHIEGEMVEIRRLSLRVSRLESWHWWLKGALAASLWLGWKYLTK